jgi:hypothetical protein
MTITRYADTMERNRPKNSLTTGGQIPLHFPTENSEIIGIFHIEITQNRICPFFQSRRSFRTKADALVSVDSRNSRIAYKEIKLRLRIFKIFMPLFQTHQNPQNAPRHKALPHNVFCQKQCPKPLPQLSKTFPLDGRTIGRDTMLTSATLNYISESVVGCGL